MKNFLFILLALALLHPVSAKDLKTRFMKEIQGSLDSDLIGLMDSLLSDNSVFTLVNKNTTELAQGSGNKFADSKSQPETEFGASAQ